jgi:uncharacterized protein (DUF427 family)
MVPENKQNRRYKQINFIDLQNNRYPSQHTVGNVHKASGNWHLRPEVTEMSTSNVSWEYRRPVRRADNLATFMCGLS